MDSKFPFDKIKTLKLFKTIETMQQKQTASRKNAYLQVLFLHETSKYMTSLTSGNITEVSCNNGIVGSLCWTKTI